MTGFRTLWGHLSRQVRDTRDSGTLHWILALWVITLGVLGGVDDGFWRSVLLARFPLPGPGFNPWLHSLFWTLSFILLGIGLLSRSRLIWFLTLMLLFVRLAWLARLGALWLDPVLSVGIAIAVLALLKLNRRFRRSSLGSGALLATILLVFLFGYSILGTYLLGREFTPPVHSLLTALYFSVVTLSTVGYGDITPHGVEARLFVSSVILLGLTVLTVSLSAIILPVLQRRLESLIMPNRVIHPRRNHFLIAGNSSLARNAYRELNQRKQKVTFIVNEPFEIAGESKLDIVVGDATDLEVLRNVQASDAKALLALSEDDSENAFVVLAAKELDPPVKTVAVVHNSKNLARLKRVRPDILIAPQVMGGRVLAMYLTGQKIEADRFMDDFLSVI
jgi:voltage-gated potassium channel